MNLAQKTLLLVGAAFGFFSVILGAFGAHALKNKLSIEMLAIFEVGVRYQMYHAIAIWLVVFFSKFYLETNSLLAGWFFTGGIGLFSGSLYLLAFTGISAFGAVTPIGGTLFLIGWGVLFFSVLYL